jgi:hypothetical protein
MRLMNLCSILPLLTQGNQAEDARALVQLLGPTGTQFCGVYIATIVCSAQAACAGNLFTAMDLADRDKLIEYVFPDGRLPVMTQVVL